MRGDSLRDLYAKSVAVAGLGLLAGVGALVDYWPADLGMPRHISGPALLARPAIPSHSFDLSQLLARAPRSTSAVSIVSPRPVTLAADAEVRPVPIAIVAVAPIRESDATTMPALPLPPPAFSTLADLRVSFLPAATPMSEPPTAFPVDDDDPYGPPMPARVLAAPATSANEESSNGGVFSDAFRKTGQSILKGGAKTGASIVDGFHALTGAFKKVPWF